MTENPASPLPNPLPRRGEGALRLAGRVVLLLFLGWLYGGDLIRWGRAQFAEVTALTELPRLWLSLLGCGVTLAGVILAVRKSVGSQPVRLFTIAVLSLFFLDFVVLSSRRAPLALEEQTQLAVQFIAQSAAREAGTEVVPRDPSLLHSFLEGLGTVPYFVRGERVTGWKLEIRERCAGPATDPGEAPVGTIVYCLASDRKQAWVTLVGAPLGQVFGARGIVSTEPPWMGEVHVATPEPPPDQAQPTDQPVWDTPTLDEP